LFPPHGVAVYLARDFPPFLWDHDAQLIYMYFRELYLVMYVVGNQKLESNTEDDPESIPPTRFPDYCNGGRISSPFARM
jgi:hypothetical protein